VKAGGYAVFLFVLVRAVTWSRSTVRPARYLPIRMG
jgi:hypothetical protein